MGKSIENMEMSEILEVLKTKAWACAEDNDWTRARQMLSICEMFEDWLDGVTND